MLLSSASSNGVWDKVNPESMLSWVFWCYHSNFTGPQQQRECFVDDQGGLQFQEIDVGMVAFAQTCSCLQRILIVSCRGWMTVELPFQVEVDLYDEEDVTRPKDFPLCFKLLFTFAELVGASRITLTKAKHALYPHDWILSKPKTAPRSQT